MTREEARRILNMTPQELRLNDVSVEDEEQARQMAIDAFLEERPHGEWIKVEFRTKEEKMFYGDAYKCSHCKVISDTHGNAPYCENCGADMREGDWND